MNQVNGKFSIHDESGQLVALIQIDAANHYYLLGRRGQLRPFRIVKGWRKLQGCRQWSVLVLRAVNGQEAKIQMATLPSQREEQGFLQFV